MKHVAQYIGIKYSKLVGWENIKIMIDWLNENVGEMGVDWRWEGYSITILRSKSELAVLFRLKFGL